MYDFDFGVNYCLFVWLVRIARCPWNKNFFASSPFDCWSLSVSCVSGTITVWLCRLSSVSSFLVGSTTTTSNVVLFFCCFEGRLNFSNLCLFFLLLCWFLDSAGVGHSSSLSLFACCFAASWLFVPFWLELLLLLLSLLFLCLFCLWPFCVLPLFYYYYCFVDFFVQVFFLQSCCEIQ